MLRTLFLLICCVFLPFPGAEAHHWVHEIYDREARFIAEVEIIEYSLINPHPLISIKIKSLPEKNANDVEVGQTWTLEMDNRRELDELGFDRNTFQPGDEVTVAVDPSFDTSYRKNTLYIRGIEHQREGFVYLHNVRQLYPIDPEGNSLQQHLEKIR